MAMSEFGKEFNAARKRGDLKFKFKGKEYTTNLKGEHRRAMYDSPADTAKFRAERDKPRTKVGQTGTRNFSSASSDSAPEDGTRKALKDLSARTSPRELGKIPPRRYSAEESKTMASREAGKEGSLTNKYRNESRMKDLEATGTMMATVAGAPSAVGAFEGMTGKELLKGAAGTIPGKIVTPAKEMGEKLSRRASDIYNAASTRGYKKGGKVGESSAMVKKEMAFMRKKGAPKSMIAHEKKEAKGMKKMNCGGGVKKYATGGMVNRGDGISRVKTRCKVC
jgi:hypothetical protein